ncbi:MAG: Uma2 family endonuclease, partial [bacterium]|nr:Uma2 family endonuclease [bacterium]
MLYRDENGVKRRISPDFMIIPFRSPPSSAHDLDAEPPPLATVEISSPKSHAADGKKKIRLYTALGIPACLVI